MGAQRRFRDRDEFGPLGAFLRLERGGTDLVIVPTERREENAVRGPRSARSNTGRGVRPRPNRPPARREAREGVDQTPRRELALGTALVYDRGRGPGPRTAGGHGDGFRISRRSRSCFRNRLAPRRSSRSSPNQSAWANRRAEYRYRTRRATRHPPGSRPR